MVLLKGSAWILAILALTACMLISAGIAVGGRMRRNKRASRIAFLLFIFLLIADCIALMIFVNKAVDKTIEKAEDLTQDELKALEQRVNEREQALDKVIEEADSVARRKKDRR